MKKVLFTNISSENFTYKWNGEPQTFKAGSTYLLDVALAIHFAKHLIDRELTKMGKDTNTPPLRTEMTSKIISPAAEQNYEIQEVKKANIEEVIASTVEDELEDEEEETQEVDGAKKRGRGRPKKVEDEFEGK